MHKSIETPMYTIYTLDIRNYRMKVFYARTSTTHQNLDRQLEVSKELGVDRVYQEQLSGKDNNRPQLKSMLDFVREGDTVYVLDYSRLARSTTDLINIVGQLQEKKVNFVSIKENVDTSTPQGKLIFTIFAGLSEFERTNLLDRQRMGIEVARMNGKYKGRKPIEKPENYEKVVSIWKKGGITALEAMTRLNLKPNTFYRMIKRNEDSC